jgi:surfeit locus 1 family protein
VSERSKFWLVSVITLIAVGVTLSLGRWQMSRAALKEQMQASVEQRGLLDKLDAAVLLANAPLETVLNRYIGLRGRWLADKTVLLDNRQMNGKVGFLVVTPLQLEGRTEAVLVQRGWAPRNFVDRAQVPAIDTPGGVVDVNGRIVPPPAKLYELGRSEAGPIRQNLDLAPFSEEIKVPLLAVSVQQTGLASEGLLRDWPAPSAGSDKNYGYAFQWFGLSALLAILYVWFQIVRRFIARKKA